MMVSLFDRVENTVAKGENAGYQHFFLHPQSFPKRSSSRLLKVGLSGKELIFDQTPVRDYKVNMKTVADN